VSLGSTWNDEESFGVAMSKQETIAAPEIKHDELLELKRQVSTLTENFERMQLEMAQQSKVLANLAARLGRSAVPAPAASAAATTPVHEKQVSPDVLVIIAAAVSAFLGKKIRIRSARMLQTPYEIVNPWSQQGRVSVQASHSLRWER
jgi:methylmalonyl-CoA carboxyltransferase 12S subunit